MKFIPSAAFALATLLAPFGTGIALAQDRPIACEYDPNMGSIRCIIYDDAIVITNVTINNGACRVWDHRLLSASLAQELRDAGKIEHDGDYTDQELDTISEAILATFKARDFSKGDFFRFESYRCTIKNIAIETPTGTYTLKTQL